MRTLIKTILFLAVMMVATDGAAQLVDRATFERHQAAARAVSAKQRKANAAAPYTITQNPYEIEEFTLEPGNTSAQVKVYFNTAVMASYRTQRCPRVGEFELKLPAGYTVTEVAAGSGLQYTTGGNVHTPITVTGYFVEETNTLQFLAYGICDAAEMALMPTGRIHYATLTVAATNATIGNYSMTMSNACFGMADEPMDFNISGTSNFGFSVRSTLATGISLNRTSATIDLGETLQLTATVTPSVANQAVTWRSSNPSVATVNSNGLVTAKAPGTATITATTQDGTNLSASCQVTVKTPSATGISLNKTSYTMSVNTSFLLEATVTPSNASQAVTWTSSNPSVATVSGTGQVTGKASGTATITATTTDGTNLSASCQFTITQPATGVTLNQTTASLVVNQTLQLTATVTPSNATNKVVTWSSSNTSVATVSSNGLVTAKAPGNATITVTTTDGSNKSATCAVTVSAQLATGITLNKTSATINNGETLQLTATVTPSSVSQAVTWSSSNTAVATVSSSGVVTAKGPGMVNITATTTDGSNLSASCAVTVRQLVTGITMSPTEASVAIGNTLQLTATVTPSNASNKALTWTSSNTSVATVNSSGLVTAKAVGTATITATTKDGTNMSATCAVTVTQQLATGITLSQSEAEIGVGETITLTATVTPANTPNKNVVWRSDNSAIATVVRGVVTGVGVGECIISATTTDGSNLSAYCLVMVTGGGTVTEIPVTGVTLNYTNISLGVGNQRVIRATVTPSNATNKGLAWNTSKASVATIDADGVLTAVGAGQCDITATSIDGTNISATCHVTVTDSSVPDYLSAEDINDVVAGQSFVIPVALTNQDDITGLQADLYLPNGIILPDYNDDDEFVTLEPSRKGRGHSVNATVTAVATRIVASSGYNSVFQGNSGTVMYIYLRMSDNASPGRYGIDLKNIQLTTPTGQIISAPDVAVNIGSMTHHSGDANGDGVIDNPDYTITVNYLLGQSVSNFMFDAADMDGNGRIIVNDLPLIIDAALHFDFDSQSNAPRRAPKQASANNRLYINDFDLAGNKTVTLNLNLNNSTQFVALQCDIVLPQGLSIVEQTDADGYPTYATLVASRSNDHLPWTDITNHGDVRMIAANSTNKTFKGSSGALAKIKVKSAAGFSGEHQILLKNIVCSDANAARYALPDAICRINHVDSLQGDVDGNGEVNGTDLNILINIVLGKDSAANYDGRADINGSGGVDGTDLNTLINILLGK